MNEPLETPRLWLRPFTMDDLDAWHAIWGDPEVIWWGANEDLERSRRSLEGLTRAEADWASGIGWLAVLERGGEEIVGDVLLQPARFVDGIEIGWHFQRHAWNRGYATEAAGAVAERALLRGHCEAVFAIVETSNAPSLRVAEKIGMQPVREMEHEGLPHRLFRAPTSPRSALEPIVFSPSSGLGSPPTRRGSSDDRGAGSTPSSAVPR